jgi:hypothetical protein
MEFWRLRKALIIHLNLQLCPCCPRCVRLKQTSQVLPWLPPITYSVPLWRPSRAFSCATKAVRPSRKVRHPAKSSSLIYLIPVGPQTPASPSGHDVDDVARREMQAKCSFSAVQLLSILLSIVVYCSPSFTINYVHNFE